MTPDKMNVRFISGALTDVRSLSHGSSWETAGLVLVHGHLFNIHTDSILKAMLFILVMNLYMY